MDNLTYAAEIDLQRNYFASGETLPIPFRLQQLQKLKSLITMHENKICKALYDDLRKSPTEAIMTEIQFISEEINFICKNLKKWSQGEKVKTPFPALWPGRSKIHFDPYGVVLIIGTWNYPALLTLSPLVGAISAGNCAIIKPSELANNTQNCIADLITNNFPAKYINVVKGGPDETTQLLLNRFDYIFFTGGTHVARIILQAAAKHLTKVTLELGGKNPCIVDADADIEFAARRIAWAKTTNAGQLCLAPDYLLVHHSVKSKLITNLMNQFKQYYGEDPQKSSDYGRIINKKHFERLVGLMRKGTIIHGGQNDSADLYISPTLIDKVNWDDPIMQEEIFGPLLPIFTFDHIQEVYQLIKPRPKSLALYLFTHNKQTERNTLQELSFGGGCINDCILQVANLHLPFGGVGGSGMGNYHGRYSFETFSHSKAIYKKLWPLDLKLEYPPYTPRKSWWLRRLISLS